MVKFDPQSTPSGHSHHRPFDAPFGRQGRRSIRLKGYGDSQAGTYYVTIVTWHREMLSGEVVNGEMILLWDEDDGNPINRKK